jgi:hypothetical protein
LSQNVGHEFSTFVIHPLPGKKKKKIRKKKPDIKKKNVNKGGFLYSSEGEEG